MLNRLIGIIYILLNKGTVTAAELAERFEVSVRTIYRDVEQLSMAGIPVFARKGKNGGISLTERFVLDKMVISEAEQQRILAALASLRETGAQEEEGILQKLGEFFKVDTPDWVAIDFSDWSGRQKQLFEEIKQAILDRRVMVFDYYGQYGDMSRRTVEPVQLLFKEYTWYVRAFCRKRQAMRLFKISRMKDVVMLDERFERYTEKDVKLDKVTSGEKSQQVNDSSRQVGVENGLVQVPSEQSSGAANEHAAAIKTVQVTFQVAQKEAYRVFDRFHEKEITILPDGNFEITICCPLDDWTYGLILSFGPSAKVISPDYVKEEMTRRIQEMQKNYSTQEL